MKLEKILSPWPSFTQHEADAVSKVLMSNKVNYWTGDECHKFEKEFASWVGTEHAIALANGTVALDVALKALEIGSGDDVIVTPRTFLASVSSVVNSGATPVFADVDRNTQAISADTIEAVLTANTKAIVVVHLGGMPAEMDEIMELADQYGLYVIEDCAQAHGAKYKGRSVGSIGHIGAWSFCQDKIMTTGGEGGMVTTDAPGLWSKMWSYKDHGKSWEAVYQRPHPPGFRWVHDSFGTNWRMTEMQAAIGRIQLKKMKEWTAARQKNAQMIDKVAERYSVVRTVKVPDHVTHAYYKHYLFVEPDYLAEGWNRDRIIEEFTNRGIPCMHGSCSEVYLEKAFEGTGFGPKNRLPNARELGETSLMFLVHPTLTEEEMSLVCNVADEIFTRASK